MDIQLKKTNRSETCVKSIQRYFSFFALLLMSTMTAHANEEATTHIVEISPGIGYYNFDSKRNIDDAPMAAVGLGLHLSRRWAVLLQYSASNTTSTVNNASQHVDMQKYHLDVHRFFNTENRLRPYLVAGFGQMDLITESSKSNKNMINAGLGLAYRMTSSWFVRADARIFSRTNNDYHDNALTLTLGYRFSNGERGD